MKAYFSVGISRMDHANFDDFTLLFCKGWLRKGDPKSRNGGIVEWWNSGMAEWRKMTPNPKTRNGGK